MAALFPQASSLAEYWANIVAGADCITDVPPSRWDVADYYDPDPEAPDKTYCRRGGFLPEVEFDPLEFGLPPNILEVTDSSQLLSLVVAREALRDAGYAQPGAFERERAGVILGVGGGQKLITPLTSRLQYPIWERVLHSSGLSDPDVQRIVDKMKLAYVGWEEDSFPGFLGNVIAGRIANRLDLGGINCVVDAACASSLAAIRMSISELVERRCDLMISGGVDTDNSPFMYLCFSKTPAFSRQQMVRPFDAEADGMMLGEGIGMVVLKRLEDAQRDGDRIYAAIRGLGASSDGRHKSIYGPRPAGQALALRRAYRDADVEPSSVGLVEAHGTGTVAGDQCEVTALAEVFGRNGTDAPHIALGTVKSQIGHTKAAAGAAGLIKAALALYHKVLPPTINVERPNPSFPWEHSPFYVNVSARPWMKPDRVAPRRAAVSAFGFGGTNYHVVLEEHEPELDPARRLHPTPREVLLVADNREQLLVCCRAALAELNDNQTFLALARATERLTEIPASAARLGFVAASPEEARAALGIAVGLLERPDREAAWDHPRGLSYRENGIATAGKIVALFSGQGSQYPNMGRELALSFPPMRVAFSRFDQPFRQDGLPLLSDTVFPIPAFTPEEAVEQAALVERTDYAQPAVGALSMGLYRLLAEAGLRTDFAAGHSFGELTALWAADALGDDDYVALVWARGKAMAALFEKGCDGGAMLAVTASADDLSPLLRDLDGVSIANVNSGRQTVLGGSTAAVEAAEVSLRANGLTATRLPVSAAFHTPLVAGAQEVLAAAIARAEIRPPRVAVYSNVTGEPYPSEPEAIRELLQRHMLAPVLFRQEIEQIYASGGSIFVEFGPRGILTGLVHEILGDRPHVAVALNLSRKRGSDRQLGEAAIRLRVLGAPLGSIDRLPEEPAPAAETGQRGRLKLALNGSNYISEKTRAAFEAALQNGPEIQMAIPPATLPQSTPAAAAPPEPEPDRAPAPRAAHSPGLLEEALAELGRRQGDLLRVHEQYLQNHAEYSRIFRELTLQQQGLLLGERQTPLSEQALPVLERSMAQFHQQQGETSRVHSQFLADERADGRAVLELVRQQTGAFPAAAVPTTPAASALSASPAPLPPAPAPAPLQTSVPVELAPAPPAPEPPPPPPPPVVAATATAQASAGALAAALLEVVSDKTGYPVDTLGLEMDVEADLGIDSIKRVEILSALRARFPELPQLKPEELGELRTLGQIVGHLDGVADAPVERNGATEVPLPLTATVLPTPPDGDGLANGLLEVVSEKTGYPVDVLELGMDLEADLGIDSIKRVEILAAMRNRFPELPQLKPEELAELRTLAQIVEHVAARLGAPAASTTNGHVAEPSLPLTDLQVSAVRLEPLPRPDAVERALPNDHICLITDDGLGTAGRLAEALNARGWRAVVLGYPEALVGQNGTSATAVERVRLDNLDETHLQATLDTIVQTHGPVGVFVHLHPLAPGAPGDGLPFNTLEKAIVKQVFLLAKHLQPQVTGAAEAGWGAFVTVTRLDGELGLGGATERGAVGGGLAGLTKTLRHEWGQVFCRAIDLSPELSAEEAAAIILRELDDPDRRLVEVAHGPRGRVTLVEASETPGVS